MIDEELKLILISSLTRYLYIIEKNKIAKIQIHNHDFYYKNDYLLL